MGRARVWVLAAILLGVAGHGWSDVLSSRSAPVAPGEDEGRLELRLGNGEEVATRPPRTDVAAAKPLSDRDVRRVLDRLPPLPPLEGEEKSFALRESSLPPPRTGATVKEAFPPPQTAPTPETPAAGPLAVSRRAPEGEVPLAPQLSLTFSQPMVAVSSHDALALEGVPVRLEPQPPGRWRWVGTKTLLFEPEPRFPMATQYRVTVPASTRSAVGGTLPGDVSFTFSTPPLQLETRYPADMQAVRQPLLFASFDQRIDPETLQASIKLAPGDVAVRLATPDEVKADATVSQLAAQAIAGRWLAFVPVTPLPADTSVSVAIAAGAPSAEGPRTTPKTLRWQFRTFGPLKVQSHECGYGGQCQPGWPWSVTLSNPLDAKAFQRDWVRVTPEVPLRTAVFGNVLQIAASAKGRTTYQVRLAAALRDQFGQTLGKDASLTFTVGSAEPRLSGHPGVVVLDPAGDPSFSVFSVNHSGLKVRAYAVGPEDWRAFTSFMQERWREADRTPPGRLALSETVPVKAAADELTETRIDLRKALSNGLGHAILIVEPSRPATNDRTSVVAWVQATKIGLDAFVDDENLVAWATSLADGKPLADCALSIDAGAAVRSGPDGVARLELQLGGGRLLVARCGNDAAILPESEYAYGDSVSWRRGLRVDGYAWHVFDDRHMYRPGEEVRLKGWIRQIGAGPSGDVRPLASRPERVGYVVSDAQGNQVAAGTAPLNAFAGFDLSIPLPPTMNLGTASVVFTTPMASAAHAFQVQEFRRPEFEVNASASAGPHVVGTRVEASVSAAYYAGGALPDAPVRWTLSQSRTSYTPPNRDDFTFGIWRPWWENWRGVVEERAPTQIDTFEARTDTEGRHVLAIDLVSVDPPRPTSLSAEATVSDVNRQAWTARTMLLVHPSELYVGLRSPRIFVQRGEKLEVDAIVTDIDGKAVGGRPLQVRAERLEWQQIEGEWKQVEVDAQDCAITSASDAVRCAFVGREGGEWRVTADVQDDRQRPNRTQIRLWVAGGKLEPSRDLTQEKVQLIPDRKEYRAGETAELLVLAPFVGAEGVLTLRRSGLIRHERFRIDGVSHTLRIPIEAGWTPNVHVAVDLVGQAVRARDDGTPDAALPARPAFASGTLDLPIPPLARTLALRVAPREKELEPGGTTTLDIEVADAAQRAVANVELAVVVVDEAVLALTGYELADPIATFYARRESGVRDVHSRSLVKLARPEPEDLRDYKRSGMRAEALSESSISVSRVIPAPPAPSMVLMDGLLGAAQSAEPIRIRTDFAALALFAGSVPTDARGRAQVTVKLPDNLTRYRVMVVGVTAGNQFGKGESTLTARLPLMVRPSAPRFLNFGDRFELPIVLQNQTDDEMKVDVALRTSNLELTDGAGRSVRVPARDRVEVRFPAAARRAGTARFQVGGMSGRFADAASISLPVWTPATSEAFATYGQLDQGAVVQPVAAPGEVVREFGGLELTTSSTALQALTDAVLYLVEYPFECAEQISSRVLAIAALRDVLAAFEADGLPAPEALVARVERDVKELAKLQNSDGGFAFWRRGDPSWPYVSIHVAHALARAREKGFAVPDDMWSRARAHLADIERHIPSEYGVETRRVLRAYALYVLERMGVRDPGRARTLLAETGVEKASLEALGWLLPVLSGDAASQTQIDAIRRHLTNRATETAATASFAVDYGEQGPHLLLHSNRRTDAVLLEALIGDQPKSDLIPKLVEGLLAQRRRGRWDSTQENAFVLLALDRYFATYEKATPDFVARAWLGDGLASEQTFRGRSTERRHVDVPMTAIAALGRVPLAIAKDGPGRLYYRIGMRYAPASLELAASDQGFAVERSYEAVDEPTDVRRDSDGTWHIRAGARVRVRLSMAAESRRYHVALVDPLPAGLEPLNPALAVTGALPPNDPQTVDVVGAPGLGGPRGAGFWWWWRRVWYEHQNLRDERVEAFTSLLWEGVYTYTYFAQATTPGSFVVPPTKAEEMYHPETFGRSASDRVVVE